MKTTIEIADDLFERAQKLARKEKTSFRALTEAGLRLVIAGKHLNPRKKLPPLVTFGSEGPAEDFQNWNWDHIRDEVYTFTTLVSPRCVCITLSKTEDSESAGGMSGK